VFLTFHCAWHIHDKFMKSDYRVKRDFESSDNNWWFVFAAQVKCDVWHAALAVEQIWTSVLKKKLDIIWLTNTMTFYRLACQYQTEQKWCSRAAHRSVGSKIYPFSLSFYSLENRVVGLTSMLGQNASASSDVTQQIYFIFPLYVSKYKIRVLANGMRTIQIEIYPYSCLYLRCKLLL
jgi:succinate dehydrogenase hydrophobic anchor subunit